MRLDGFNGPSEKQVDYIKALQRQLHLPDELLDQHCVLTFSKPFSALGRGQASMLIDELLTWKTVPAHLQRLRGQQDLPGMGGAA